jgi:hypothetical protein
LRSSTFIVFLTELCNYGLWLRKADNRSGAVIDPDATSDLLELLFETTRCWTVVNTTDLERAELSFCVPRSLEQPICRLEPLEASDDLPLLRLVDQCQGDRLCSILGDPVGIELIKGSQLREGPGDGPDSRRPLDEKRDRRARPVPMPLQPETGALDVLNCGGRRQPGMSFA